MDEYIAGFPEEVRSRLEQIRALVREMAPEAEEAMKYGLPTFVLKGNLVHFGAFTNHVGLYPTPTGIEAFADELAGYAKAKGSVQFPHSAPLPLELIRRIVAYRIEQNRAKRK